MPLKLKALCIYFFAPTLPLHQKMSSPLPNCLYGAQHYAVIPKWPNETAPAAQGVEKPPWIIQNQLKSLTNCWKLNAGYHENVEPLGQADPRVSLDLSHLHQECWKTLTNYRSFLMDSHSSVFFFFWIFTFLLNRA